MLGRVGNDTFGDFLLNNLTANNVDTTLIQRDDASTGTAIIVVDEHGQNSIVLSAGANGQVTPSDVSSASFSTFNLLLLQLEIPTLTVLFAARRAKENNVRVILNPAPAQELPDELIALADFIIPNETELSLLTGMDVNDVASAESAARVLLNRGAKHVIVTLGSKGALMVESKQVDKYTSTHVDTFAVEVVDSTAAGDAFIGGFAVKLIERSRGSLTPADALENAIYIKHIENAVRYACACGALATTKFGAQPSLPTKEEVENFLNKFLP
jgi:ribokinase